jgi:hypothetical protein
VAFAAATRRSLLPLTLPFTLCGAALVGCVRSLKIGESASCQVTEHGHTPAH